jgi:hypothetical protein
MQNTPENGSGAWIALCTYPTHSDTDIEAPLKRRSIPTKLYGSISQKTVIFILFAMKT